MTSTQWAGRLVGVVGVAVVSLPAGVLLSLAAAAMLARKDFRPIEATTVLLIGFAAQTRSFREGSSRAPALVLDVRLNGFEGHATT